MEWNGYVQHYYATENFEIPYACLLTLASLCSWQECAKLP